MTRGYLICVCVCVCVWEMYVWIHNTLCERCNILCQTLLESLKYNVIIYGSRMLARYLTIYSSVELRLGPSNLLRIPMYMTVYIYIYDPFKVFTLAK